MRLNVQSDLALRLLTYLAVNGSALCTISEVAARFDVSENHLMKVAHLLGKGGFIDTVRGRSGGLRLASKPSEIWVGEVVRYMEGGFDIVECFQNPSGGCIITPACRLKNVLGEAVAAFMAVLDRFTLDDLTTRNDALAALLAKEPG